MAEAVATFQRSHHRHQKLVGRLRRSWKRSSALSTASHVYTADPITVCRTEWQVADQGRQAGSYRHLANQDKVHDLVTLLGSADSQASSQNHTTTDEEVSQKHFLLSPAEELQACHCHDPEARHRLHLDRLPLHHPR